MKGSAITGPVGKEAADLWPVSYRSSLRVGETENADNCVLVFRSVSLPTLASSCKVAGAFVGFVGAVFKSNLPFFGFIFGSAVSFFFGVSS